MNSDLFEQFMDLKNKNVITIKEAKESGTKVVGIYCTYGPRELVIAAGAVPVGICGTHEETIPIAEKTLPGSICPVVKSSYGFAVSDRCPYFYFSDLVIGETTCDAKKKMFELLKKIKPVHVINLPQGPDSEAAKELMYAEIKKLKTVLEKTFDVEITDARLRDAIKLVNENNRALKRLHDLNAFGPAIISGSDILKISFQLGFHTDRRERTRMLDSLTEFIRKSGQQTCMKNGPRVLITGTPIGMGCEKIIDIVEQCEAVAVAQENCFGYKTLGIEIDENDPRDPLLLIAEKHLKIPCAVMSPNKRRFELVAQMIQDFKVDAVIDLSWQFCHTYNIESYFMEKMVKQDFGIPYIHVETDFSNSDIENLRVRIEALLEMV